MILFEDVVEYENTVTGIRTTVPKRGGEVQVIMLKSMAACMRPIEELKPKPEPVASTPRFSTAYNPDRKGSINDFFNKFTKYGNM